MGRGAELLGCPESRSNLHFLLNELSKRGIKHLLVEGGPTVVGSFLKDKLADEIVVYVTPKILGNRGAADIAEGLVKLDNDIQLHYVRIKGIGDDVRINGLTKNGIISARLGAGVAGHTKTSGMPSRSRTGISRDKL